MLFPHFGGYLNRLPFPLAATRPPAALSCCLPLARARLRGNPVELTLARCPLWLCMRLGTTPTWRVNVLHSQNLFLPFSLSFSPSLLSLWRLRVWLARHTVLPETCRLPHWIASRYSYSDTLSRTPIMSLLSAASSSYGQRSLFIFISPHLLHLHIAHSREQATSATASHR